MDNNQTTDILDDLREAIAEGAGTLAERCIAEIEDLRASVVAFGTPAMVQWAEFHALPKGHLYPMHYDLLKRCGARMEDFARADIKGQTDV